MAISTKFHYATALTGGAAGALDAKDGTALTDGWFAVAFVSNVFYFYILDADNAGAESSPDIISPDANAGDKRWVLQAVFMQTLDRTLNGQDNILQRVNLLDYGTVTNAIGAIGGGAQTIDLTLGNAVVATVDTAETTFTFSNPTASDEECGFVLYLTNGGSQTVNWPASVDWAGGSAPDLTSSGLDVLVFTTVDGGTTWFGFVAGLDMQ